MNYRLVSEVIRYWRADPEERALAEAVLELLGINRQDLESKSVQEIENELRYCVNSKGCSKEQREKAVAPPQKHEAEQEANLPYANNSYNNSHLDEISKQQDVPHTEISIEDKQEQEQLNTTQVHPVTQKIKRGRRPNV